MQFNTILVLTGLLSTLSQADPVPQSPAQTTAAASQVASYLLTLETDPAFLSFASDVATNPGLASTLASIESSVSSLTAHGQTPTSGYLNALPTEVQPLFKSMYSVEYSILSQNGFLAASSTMAAGGSLAGGSTMAAGGTSSSKGAAPTSGVGSKVKVVGAVAAGFVGAVMAL